jgi:hypothetical protein
MCLTGMAPPAVDETLVPRVLVFGTGIYGLKAATSLGYRHLDLDFDDNGLVLDATMSGPFVAFDFQW